MRRQRKKRGSDRRTHERPRLDRTYSITHNGWFGSAERGRLLESGIECGNCLKYGLHASGHR